MPIVNNKPDITYKIILDNANKELQRILDNFKQDKETIISFKQDRVAAKRIKQLDN